MRRAFQFAVGLVLLLAALTPLLELCDHWDKSVVPATDTEMRVMATFACAGLLATVATLMRWRPAPARATRRSVEAQQQRQSRRLADFESIEPTASPPLLPLRI